MKRRPALLVLVLALALFAAPAAAQAATRYASPAGIMTGDCPQTAPCDIATAINDASSGDTVIIEDGTYGSAGTPIMSYLSDGGNALTIEGQSVGPQRPVIYMSTAGAGLQLTGNGTTLSDVEIVQNGSDGAGLDASGSVTVTRVYVESGPSSDDACDLTTPAAITDSVCWEQNTTESSGLAAYQGAVTLDNDTIVGASFGLYSDGADVNASNSILEGGTNKDVFNNAGTISLTDDEYTTTGGDDPITGSGQVSAPPVFADAATGDFHETGTSPSLGQGLDSPANGPFDLDGNSREIDGQTDIGAYEYVSAMPTATTTAASPVGTTTATLNGSFDAGGAPATYQFEFGSTPSLGLSTPAVSVPGTSGPQPVNAALAGLAPGGTYYFKLVVTTALGTQAGQVLPFETYASVPPTITITTPASGAQYTVGQKVSAQYSCSGNSGGPGIAICAGTVASGNALDTATTGTHTFTVDATDRAGNTATQTVDYTVVEPTPKLSDVHLKPRRFTAATHGGPTTSNKHAGAKLSYKDSLAARTTIKIYRKGRHGRLVLVGSFTHKDHKGSNSFRISGRLGGKALPPRDYVLKLTATLNGRRSRPLRVSLTILS